MADSGANSSAGAAPKAPSAGAKKTPVGKQRFYFSPYANKKISSDYHDSPYTFYVTEVNASQGSPTSSSSPFECILNKDTLTKSLPNGWKLYFHDDDATVLRPEIAATQIIRFRDYLKDSAGRVNLQDVQESTAFQVDSEDLGAKHWKGFEEDYKANPEHTISCLSLAMHLQLNASAKATLPRRHLLLVTPRITQIDLPISYVKSLSMEDCGSLVRIRGNVIQASESTIDWLWRTYKCGVCGTKQVVLQRDGKTILPNSCRGCNQRGKDYEVDLQSYFNVAEESQKLKLQEIRTVTLDSIQKRQDLAAIMDIVVKSDLVNRMCPGMEVMVTGVLKSRSECDVDRRIYFYLDVVTMQTNEDADERNFDHSENDYLVIQRMKSDANPLRTLVQSFCPKIIGQEMVKAALLLGMFSISPRNYMGRRLEAHVLVVGDPGLGKSELLEAASQMSPRGVFVSSNSCTNTGLTATMTSDSAQKSTIEAGALVMADQGCCCIDELDKITASMDVLLEAMEDQVVNIAKAGVINKLRAKTSVLAAANPVGGHYNKTKRITENLKIGLPVLSRFDLVLVLLDQKNSAVDGRLVGRGRGGEREESIELKDSFQQRLKVEEWDDDGKREPLSMSSMQKFLSYVNRKFVPELSHDAKIVIKEFYQKLRKQPFYSDTIPVTTRALLSLIRLTQARAKIDLCRRATKRHAEDVVELYEFGMRDVRNITEEDILIQANLQNKEPKVSKAKQLNNFTRLLQIRAKDARLSMFSKSDLKELGLRAGIRNVNDIIELMNVNGVLIKKNSDSYEFQNY